MTVRPIERFVLLADEPEETVENGVVVRRGLWSPYLDFYVAAVGEREECDFGAGDRVVLADPNAGRKLRIDGAPYRLVRVSDIIGVLET